MMEKEKNLKSLPKLPFGLKVFVVYGVFMGALDLICFTRLPFTHALAASIGWFASTCYFPPIIGIALIKLSPLFPESSVWNRKWIFLRYIVLALMLLKAFAFVFTFMFSILTQERYNSENINMMTTAINFINSVIIPIIWIYVWFGGAVARYLKSI